MISVSKFIVLVERHRLMGKALAGLSALALVVSGIGLTAAHAGPGKGKGRDRGHKAAADLRAAADAPTDGRERWVKRVNGRRFVEAVVISNAADPELRDLSDYIERLGGSVKARLGSVRGLMAMVPARELDALAEHANVESVSPNRTTRRSYSTLALTTGAMSGSARQYSSSSSYSGYDGRDVGIAVLDSGVMQTHASFAGVGEDAAARVAKNLDFVNFGGASFLGPVAGQLGARRAPMSTTCACSATTAWAACPTCWPASTG